MKKIILSIAMVLTVLFLGGMNTNAEVRNPIDPEEGCNERIELMTEKHDAFLEEKKATFQSKRADALVRQSKKLALVNRYAPELYQPYMDAFSDHTTVHEALHATHVSLREEAFNATMEKLIALKEELYPLVQAGTMTYREVGAELRLYLEEQRATHRAIREAYAQEISDLNAQNDVNKAMVDALKAGLRGAIEAKDIASANDIIKESYDYLLGHIQYDNDKLDILNNISF